MLARQFCLRQARSANAGRSVYPACTTPSCSPRRCYAAAGRPARTSRTTIGTATVVDVDSVPTILKAKDNFEGLTKDVVRNLEKEYKNYLQNPWKLSEAIKNRLQKDRYEEALVLARRATKDGQVPVCWNILIDYLFRKQRLHAGIKLFNEMKKRGQLPTAQTFTVIFKGCAASVHPKTAVSEAMKIYMTMLTSTRVRPNIIHTNAIIHTCARALDLEAMMSVAETIDDRERRPDSVTYSTLLHGLRAVVDKEAKQLPHTEKNGYTAKAHAETVARVLEQAKRIWEEVIRKWKAGALVLDEKLVCAMGRLLLLGNNADKMSILDLVEQTMAIPNLNRKDPEVGGDRSTTEGTKGEGDAATSKPAPTAPQRRSALTPAPSTKTLSIVLSALQDTRRVHLTLGYWRLLTGDYKIEPDANNWNTLLYSLRRSHSSSQIATALRAMPAPFIADKNFRYALQACVADKVNPQVMQNANDILDRMVAVLPRPDMETLRYYLDVATTSHHQFRLGKKKGADPAKLDAAYGEQVAAALEKLWGEDVIPACRGRLVELLEAAERSGGEPPTRKPRARRGPAGTRDGDPEQSAGAAARNYASEFVALMRKVVAAWDRVITDSLLPEEKLAPLRPRRNAVNRFVGTYFSVLQEHGVLAAVRGERGGRSARAEGEGESKRGEREGAASGEEVPGEVQEAQKEPRDEGALIRRQLAVTRDFASQAPK